MYMKIQGRLHRMKAGFDMSCLLVIIMYPRTFSVCRHCECCVCRLRLTSPHRRWQSLLLPAGLLCIVWWHWPIMVQETEDIGHSDLKPAAGTGSVLEDVNLLKWTWCYNSNHVFQPGQGAGDRQTEGQTDRRTDATGDSNTPRGPSGRGVITS